jgi:hypothetical protein
MNPAGIFEFVAVGAVIVGMATLTLGMPGPTVGSDPVCKQFAPALGRGKAPMPTVPKARPCQSPPVHIGERPKDPKAAPGRPRPGAPLMPAPSPPSGVGEHRTPPVRSAVVAVHL